MSSRSQNRSRQHKRSFQLSGITKFALCAFVLPPLLVAAVLTTAVMTTYPKLPRVTEIKKSQLKEPLSIYSSDGILIGTYGNERREFTTIDKFPKVLRDAVLAAEDQHFYQHHGINSTGLFRLIGKVVVGDFFGKVSLNSTLTQQVARNIYLTNEQSTTRKFNEMLLAYKMERELSKDEILEVYFNQIYLGEKTYGFAAAAKLYFNKPVQDLTLAEAAILAGLPKAPSAFNPLKNPERAKQRQEAILKKMLDLGMITSAQHQAALNQELFYERYRLQVNQDSLYAAEMARLALYEKYGEDAYTQGFKVYTTVSIANQKVATAALRRALHTWTSKNYRGAEAQLDLSSTDDVDSVVEQHLAKLSTVEGMIPAVIIGINRNVAEIQIQGGIKAQITVPVEAIGAKRLGENRGLKVGSVIRVKKNGNAYALTQQPEIQGALISMETETGAIRAVVGGYDFHSSQFNRATQSTRTTGDAFMPFVYSAALSKGMTPATLVNDAPFTYKGWSPQNLDGSHDGMMPLSTALIKSKNVVSVRVAHAMGVPYVHKYIQRFGFRPKQIPEELKLATGKVSVNPLQMAEGYAAFANGGYRVSGYIVDKIYDSKGNLRARMEPLVAGQNAQQIIDSKNAYLMTTMLRGVITSGTARHANALGRRDIAGKTGTTNDNKDTWFVGYNPKLVTAVYIGYDTPRRIAQKAYGDTVALPVWVDYMKFALKGMPDVGFQPKTGGKIMDKSPTKPVVINNDDLF